jgi:NitT/TauT family transport system substrate-binding protein
MKGLEMAKYRRRGIRAIAVAASGAVLAACLNVSSGGEGGGNLGEPGEPINLTIGYQPYYTQAWSGVAMRGKNFWEKYLPEGSNVTFETGLQGSVIVSQMLGGKQMVGYVGDMPGIVATSKRDVADVRIVASLGMASDQCNIFLTVPDAPNVPSPKDAVGWMDGKVFATPEGSCTDRFARAAFEQDGINTSAYLNQSIEVIASNFETNRIDAAAIWEPNASRLVNNGVVKRVASGANFDLQDAGLLIMSKSLIDKRPDIVEGFLKAELEAQQWVADPKNAMELAQLAVDQTEGFTLEDMWDSMFKDWPVEQGGHPEDVSNHMSFIIDDELQGHIRGAWAFLHGAKVLPQAAPIEDVVMDEITRKVLDESGAEFPLDVKYLPASEFKGK